MPTGSFTIADLAGPDTPAPASTPMPTGKRGQYTVADLAGTPATSNASTGDTVLDAVMGGATSLISHASNIYKLVRKIPGADKVLPDPAAFDQAIKDVTPENTPGHIGKFLENAAEFAIPAGEVEKALTGGGLAARAGAQAGVGAGVAGIQSGGNPASIAAGAVTGGAGPVIGDVAETAASKLAPALYQSALKPAWSMVKKQGTQMVDTGLGLQIPISGEGAAALDAHIQALRDEINQGIDQHAAAGRTVDSTQVLQSLDGLKDWARNTLDPQPKLQAIQRLEDNFIEAHGEKIPLDKAQQLKINTYGEIKNSYGEMSGVETEAKKQLARGLKEQIGSVFPEIANLNEQQSKALGLDEALARAVFRIDNKDLIPMSLPIAAAGGHALMGGPGAAATVIGKVLLDNPTLKSKLAIAIGKQGVQNATAVVASRLGSLTKAGAVSALEPQTPQLSAVPAQ